MISVKAKSASWRWAVTLALAALLVGGFAYWLKLEKLQDDVVRTFQIRSDLINRFAALQHERVAVMRDLFQQQFAAPKPELLSSLKFKRHPTQGFYELEEASLPLSGNLTGTGDVPQSPEHLREIAASLGMEAQITTAERLGTDTAWFYYQSARHFIYLSPQANTEELHLQPSFYEQDYWKESGPEQNPSRGMRLTGPYQDEGGKGWVMTFAKPVYDQDRFMGVVAMDIQVRLFETLTALGHAPGESILLGANGHVVARQEGITQDNTMPLPQTQGDMQWFDDGQGVLWMMAPVTTNEYRLLHRLSKKELHLTAIRETAGLWVVMILLGLILSMAWRLRQALTQMTRMTLIDPLTQLYNRRGLFERAEMLVNLAQRETLTLAVLIMDIDYFKKINDTHGHGAGDSVLRQIGEHLSAASRTTDVVCRWGGEEFVVLMLLQPGHDAREAAERLRQAAQKSRIPPEELPVTLSGGLVLGQTGEPVERGIQRADALLYQAKQAGRNRIMCDDEQAP